MKKLIQWFTHTKCRHCSDSFPTSSMAYWFGARLCDKCYARAQKSLHAIRRQRELDELVREEELRLEAREIAHRRHALKSQPYR